MILVLSNP